MADRLSKGTLYRVVLGATSVMVFGAIAMFSVAHHFAA
jgi:hypothetical protein